MRRAILVVLICLAASFTRPARADTFDVLFKVAADVLGEPALLDAKELIKCIHDHGAQQCAGQAIESQVGGAVKKFTPDDPLIKKAVQLIGAIDHKDWLQVLGLAGGAALNAACKAGFVATGPLNTFFCGAVANLAEPVIKTVIVAIQNPSPANLLAAIGALADPDIACDVIPSFPGKDALCGPLGDAIELAKDAFNEAKKFGQDAGEFLVNVGTGAVSVPGAALEGACQLLTICDDDSGKNYLSQDNYYKYVVFPYIERWVGGKLYSAMDAASLYEKAHQVQCLMYYDYYTIKDLIPAIGAKIDAMCKGIVARLHQQGEALAMSLGSAAQAYLANTVKPQVPYSALEGYGKTMAIEFREFMQTACASNLETAFPMPHAPNYPGEGAWMAACEVVSSGAEAAYAAETKQIEANLKSLNAAGCANPPGWTPSKGIHVTCNSYPVYHQCTTAFAVGDEQAHCKIDQAKADAALAKQMVAELGEKRCKATGASITCTRPWKFERCKELRAALVIPGGLTTKVACSEGPMVAVIAFAALSQQTSQILHLLNGDPPPGSGPMMALAKPAGGQAPAAANNCAPTWDPLAITCQKVPDVSPVKQAFPGISFVLCAADPAHDGADSPCRVAAPGMVAQAVQPALGNSRFKPDQTRDLDKPMRGKVEPESGRFVQQRTTEGAVRRDADLNEGRTPARATLKRIRTAPLRFVGQKSARDAGRGSAGGREYIAPPGVELTFSVPYSFSNVDPKLSSATIRCVASAGPKTQPLGAGQEAIALSGQAARGSIDIGVQASAGEKLQEARAYTCALQLSDGKMSITPQAGAGPNWARSAAGSVSMVSGTIP